MEGKSSLYTVKKLNKCPSLHSPLCDLMVNFFCFLLRCGESERPLNEFLILHLGTEHPNDRYNISICKIFGRQCNQEKKTSMQDAQNQQVHGFRDSMSTIPVPKLWYLSIKP